jgi:hypothetical protein
MMSRHASEKIIAPAVQRVSAELDAHNIQPLESVDVVFSSFLNQPKTAEKQLMRLFDQGAHVPRPSLLGRAQGLWWQFWCVLLSQLVCIVFVISFDFQVR